MSQSDDFRGPGDWKAQANRVETPNPVWDMPDVEPDEADGEQAGDTGS
jgi:hypothetical protein